MGADSGHRLLAQALKDQGAETVFFLLGSPNIYSIDYCIKLGIRTVHVHHEQAAAMMAHAWGRVQGKPGVCMGSAGPGVTNLVTGVANALYDCYPLIVLGGSSRLSEYQMEAFHDLDQVSVMNPVTKWSARVPCAERIPDYVARAYRMALSGRPGPVYLDFPADVLAAKVERESVCFPVRHEPVRPQGDPAMIARAVELLTQSHKPIIISGSGALLSEAGDELLRLVETYGIPFYTTPQGRGIIPEDHPLCFPGARSTAFKEADVVLVAGTRLNWILFHGKAPHFNEQARMIQIDTDAGHLGQNRDIAAGIVGDARLVLRQIIEAAHGRLKSWKESTWTRQLQEAHLRRETKLKLALDSEHSPIHPARLCREIRDFLDRDAVLVVDGDVTLNWARQTIPTYHPRHRLNSGPFGCIGVGLPFGIGAKIARPDKQVVVLTGDGAFGLSAMEMHTAVREKAGVIIVVNNNSSWGNIDPEHKWPQHGNWIGEGVRYDLMVSAMGGYGETVERPQDIRPALKRAAASGLPSCINVLTDPYVGAERPTFLFDADDVP